MNENKKPGHILLATTGESPQVVTETLYAIDQKGLQWPDEIRLITTTLGRDRAAKGLIEEGHLQRLCNEIERPCPLFDRTHIMVVPNADNQEVDDARSEQDHEALGNFIMAKVRELSATDDTGQPINARSIHASLAGGRKTMTFYLGYAMSLFGRKQDRLSHVLVNDKCYESGSFWFPTNNPEHQYLKGRDGKDLLNSQGQPAEATPRYAEVTLADIPFIRQRHQLPKILGRPLQSEVDFREIVALVNLAEQREYIGLSIDRMQRTITVSSTDPDAQINPVVFSDVGYLEMALYSALARATLENHIISRPSKNQPSELLLGYVMAELMPMFGLEPDERPIDSLDRLEDWCKKAQKNKISLSLNPKTLLALRGEKLSDAHPEPVWLRTAGVTFSWFDDRRTNLRELFEDKLPAGMISYLLPSRTTKYRIDLPRLNIRLM